MKLKLKYRRPTGASVDVMVTTEATAQVSDVARELVLSDPDRPRESEGLLTLTAGPIGERAVRLPPDRAVGESALASGFEVEVVEATQADGPAQEAAIVHILGGPEAGRRVSIPAGSTTVGRRPEEGRPASADLLLEDNYVSRRHARIDVGTKIEVVDLNSANGVIVDGEVADRVTLLPGQEVQLGDTRLTVMPSRTVAAPVEQGDVAAGAVPFRRSPRVEARFPSEQLPRPSVPSEPLPPIFPFLMLLAPIIMGTSMYLITGNKLSLVFVAMSPMMMTTNYVTTRKKGRRQVQHEVGRFDEQLVRLERRLSAGQPQELAARQAEAPAVALVYEHALSRRALLWTRRPEHWSFLHLRLGTATMPSRTTIAPPGDGDDGMPEHTRRLEELEERFRWCADVPVLESFSVAGSLGVTGREASFDVLRGLVVQLTGLHSPAELVLAALSSPAEVEQLAWLSWLPHTSSPHSPLEGQHLADSQVTGAAIISALERLIAERIGDRPHPAVAGLGPLATDLAATATGSSLGEGELPEPPPLPSVVLLVTEHAPIDRSRVVQLAEQGSVLGIHVVWLADSPARLPAVCRTFVDVSEGLDRGRAHFVRHGAVVDALRVEGVSIDNATRFALALAPLVDSGAAEVDASDLPRSITLLSQLGPELATSPAAVVDRWRQNESIHDRSGPARRRARAGTLRALVGQRAVDAMHLDLRSDGPHALVGGTTGAGKSEFLQAWVLGMAAEYSPDRVSFLFVDYKGGSAFGDCVRLPHSVGMVTDLSQHLVRRALTSLRAELRHREHLLNRKDAKDLLELEKRGDPEAPPALVVVIDEFAALVNEVPEFVDGVVDVAQRGRSLGIHLIVATQRPAGVIKDNLRANTNLRIALRMADENDSTDVIGTPVAATFDHDVPGRGVAKSGPGRLTTFQSAYAGGHTSEEAEPASVLVQRLKFGADERWARPQHEDDAGTKDLGPSDQVRLVDTMIDAADLAAVPKPRKPWLEELSEAYDLKVLGPRTDAELLIGVADLPDRQAQEVMAFSPDLDGNLAIYGTGGTGKSVLLRTLVASAGVTPRGGPVHVYCLDFAAGGLRMLEQLPHVGAVITADERDRVVRLFRTLRKIAEDRARAYPLVNAGSVAEYRNLADRPEESRILVMIDGFPAFREAFEGSGTSGECYATLQQLLSEGRQLGIHILFTADRPGSVPGSVAASVPRRVVLRLADETAYMMLGVPGDVLGAGSPPGRAMVDAKETQVAILGGSGNVSDQSQSMSKLARAMQRQDVQPAPEIRSLPLEVSLDDMPREVDGRPVLGISDETLEPVGVEPHGIFVVGGGPGSGRSNTLLAMAQSVRRWQPGSVLVYLGPRRSSLPAGIDWDVVATSPEDIASTCRQVTSALAEGDRARHTTVFVEGVADIVGTAAESALLELLRAIRRSDHFVVAESDTASLGMLNAVFTELRSARRGLLLQPEYREGETLLKTAFPRLNRSEFPVGRGMAVLRGRPVRVQVPLASDADVPVRTLNGHP